MPRFIVCFNDVMSVEWPVLPKVLLPAVYASQSIAVQLEALMLMRVLLSQDIPMYSVYPGREVAELDANEAMEMRPMRLTLRL